jgi:serine/threonine protein kinase
MHMTRKQLYFYLSSQIAQKDNDHICSLFETDTWGKGWGKNQTIEIEGHKVFIKRVPLTDKEYENLFVTKNLYNMPTYYNYGVGSAGFGAFRELVAHIKTTNWVLNDEIETFPLMYHYRILPISREPEPVDSEAVDWTRQDNYIAYWGGDANIKAYMEARHNCHHELVLFLEYIPHILHTWLQENPDKTSFAIDNLRHTIDFLREKDIIHFDAHYHNILTDGERMYLTDFGLVLDKNFDLTPSEQDFFDTHTHYDYGEVIAGLGFILDMVYSSLPDDAKNDLRQRYQKPEDVANNEMPSLLLDDIDAVHKAGLLPLDKAYVACLVQYRPVITLMDNFYSALRANPQKDTPFPHDALKELLQKTGFISTSIPTAETH